jgi:hypothetical protein
LAEDIGADQSQDSVEEPFISVLDVYRDGTISSRLEPLQLDVIQKLMKFVHFPGDKH